MIYYMMHWLDQQQIQQQLNQANQNHTKDKHK